MKINIFLVLTILFVVLKLINAITWSWWWIFSPLWIPLCIFIVLIGIIYQLYLIIKIFSHEQNFNNS